MRACAKAALAAVLLAGCTSGGTPAASPSSSPPTTASATPAARPSPTDGPVPKGFRAASVTFVSEDHGWVLGTAPCATAPCTSVLRTRDGGRHWSGVPAPKEDLKQVQTLRFGSERDGYAFGARLVTTHDGGATWHSVDAPGPVADLQIARGVAWAAFGKGSLYRSEIGTDTWQRVDTVPDGYGLALVHGDTVVAHGEHDLRVTEDGGRTWRTAKDPCPDRPNEEPSWSFTATGDTDLAALCSGEAAAGTSQKAVYVTTDAGRTWRRTYDDTSGGDGGEIAGATATTYVIASSSAVSLLYRSTDGAKSFKAVDGSWPDGGLPWTDLGFTTQTQGVVILGAADLYMTRDAGATWTKVTF